VLASQTYLFEHASAENAKARRITLVPVHSRCRKFLELKQRERMQQTVPEQTEFQLISATADPGF
jgi:hypothetical protein